MAQCLVKNCDGIPTWVVGSCPSGIGDTGPAGGIIFYVTDATEQHGLEAAPEDQSNGIQWGCVGTVVGTSTAIDTGKANTTAINAQCGAETAASIAASYSLNGFSDWYLPSQDELNLLYALLILLSGNAFAVTYATQPALNTEISNRKSGDSIETARAKVAEGALKAADTAEVSNRNKAIGTAIATETARAKAAEGALKAADTAEVTNRNTAIGTAIASEVTNRDTAIATETARAMAAEAAGSFSYSMTCGVSGTDACKVGAVGPGGGWIFFVDYNEQYSGFNYLEAAPADISAVAWCNITTTSIPAVAGWSARAVGAGQANTDAITQACTSGAANSAVAYFTPTTQAGDWFLGTLGDMMLMYTNLSYAGVGGFASSNYWSSTELNSNFAWSQNFDSGTQNYPNKLSSLPVRAVRAF